MSWTVRPHHATNLQGRDFQVQGLYQSQQAASGFSQASASIQNSSAYVGNVQATKIHSSTENMVPNQIPSQNNVGSNNFQPPLLNSSVPVTGFGTAQHFVDQHPDIRVSSMTVQRSSGMAKNTWPNSNLHIISSAAPQFSTGNPVQRPANQYNNPPQKTCSNSVQGLVYWGNINSSSCSKRLPMIAPKHQPANIQTHATVPPNQVSGHFVNSQQNSSYLIFPSGQNIQNQINGINSGTATAMQSQQYASNYAYSSAYTIPAHYAAQVIPQATDTNLPPSYPVPPIQINHGQLVLPQPVPNPSNENVQHSQNLALDQSNISYLVQHVQTPQSAPVSRGTNEVGGAANSIHGHNAENQPFDEMTKSAVEALKTICDDLQIPGTVPLDKTPTPQTSRSMVEDYTDKSSGNALNSLMKFKESLELDMENILAMRKKLLKLQGQFKLKHQVFRSVAQKSKASDPSVHNPDFLLPKSNTSQQTAPLPQATHQTFSLPSHNATQNLTSLLPQDSAQNQPPLLACSSNQIQDRTLLPLKKRNYSNPILQGLLKGRFDEEMLLNTLVASTEKNQSKQLFPQEMCFSGSVLDSSDVKSKTNVNDMKRASRLSPKTSPTVSTQESLTSTNGSLVFEQISALGKDQLTNTSAMSGGDNGFVLNKDKVGTTVTKSLTLPQSTVSVQNPTESSQLSEKLAKEGTKNPHNLRSEFIQQSKYHCFQTTEKSIMAWNNQNDISSSASLATAVPEASIVQRSSFTGNSCTMGRTCSLEELETSLALWRKSPAASLNGQLGGSTKPTMHSSSLDGAEDKEMNTMKNFPNALTYYEKSSTTAEKNEPTLSSVSSSLGQKLDTVNSSPSKSSEPQVAIVPPLIISKEENWNEVQKKSLSSVLGKNYPVIAEGSVHSLHEVVLLSDTDKLVKTACSPSDSCVTVKVGSDMHQKPAKCTNKNGIQRAESETACSYDPNQGLTGPLDLGKNTSQLYSRESFPPGTSKDNSSPVSQKCSKANPDLVEPEDTVLSENVLQISSVCTLVQGDALYNSQIANIFNTSSKAEHNISSEDQRSDSYHEEQQLNHWRRESGMNGSRPVGGVLLPSLCTLSKTIAEKLLSLPGLKMPRGGKVSNEVNVRESEEGKNTELVNPDPAKVSEQNTFCSNVHSKDLASGNQEVLGNSIADESITHGIQDDAPSDENQVHSVNNIDIALTLLSDQLTELLEEFPYGIDASKALKNTEKEDSATKVSELKDGQEIRTCGQNSEVNHELDQITITILNPQQMKELFPESHSQSSNKLENEENDELVIASENADESHIHSTLIESTNTSTETVQKPAGHSFCCTQAWLALKYAVEPCKHMLAKEAALKQQLVQYLPSEIIIKERSETETSSTDCQLNNQQQTLCPISNNLPSEVESNRILSKTVARRESDLQEKECKPLKDDDGLTPCLSLEKLEPPKMKNKEQSIEEVLENVQFDELWKQELVSESQEQLSSERDYSKRESVNSACERELSVKKRTPRETVVDKSKSNTLLRRCVENKHSKKEYKIKRDSSETHIIKGPTRTFKRGLKKHIASKGKQKTKERPCSIVTDFSNLSNVDSVSKVENNAQRSQEHVNRQKCEIERDLENNKTMRTEHKESSSSEPVEQNKGSLARTDLKKFAYLEERGNKWKYRRLLSNNINTSNLQTFRGQLLNMNKALSSSKRGAYKRDKCFAKTLFDKSPCRKINTLTLQREQKKNYLNKVAFKQTDQSICLTELEHSPSKSAWHVKPSNASKQPENKYYIPSPQQSEEVKPQMLEFKMCPEIVFRNLVSEDVSDAMKIPEKEIIPVSAVKSRREDWLNYIPQKRRKTDEKETQVDDRIPLDTAMELLEKNEVVRSSNATFETFRKMHLKKSRSLDSSPVN